MHDGIRNTYCKNNPKDHEKCHEPSLKDMAVKAL